MKICIVDKDIVRAERIKFICEKVLLAMDTKAEFVSITDLAEIKDLLNEKQTILIFNEDNDVISAENLVDFVITNGAESILIAIAETKQKLFRFLPADPYALMLTDMYESEIIMNLSNAIDHLINNA